MTGSPPRDLDLSIADDLLAGAAGRDLLRTASAHAGATLVRTRLRSVHHRPGRSVSHVHEATLRVGDVERDVLLVAHLDRRPLPEGTFALETDGIAVAVWRFPNDPFLPGLPSTIAPTRVRELLDQLGGPPGSVTLHTRAYRPSRRAVVEVTVREDAAAGRVLYLKVLAGDRAAELADLHRQLAPHVPVPAVIGVAPTQGIVALQALAGRTLRAALVEGALLPAAEALVELSTRFSASGLSSRRDPRAFADPSRHVAGLLRLAPDRAGSITTVAEAATRLDADRPLVPVHGDLHDGQLLLDAAGRITGLLDVDGAGTGSLAQDAGNLVAHVAAIGEVWPSLTDRAETYAAAVADVYRPVVGADALARATAGAWLGLATGPHRAQDEGWPEATRRRIDRADRELAAARYR
jgi:hypothetical protein